MNPIISIPVIAAGDAPDDSVFQPQVVQEPGGAVVVGPLFHNDQLSDAIGRTGSFIRMHILIIFIYPIISRMMAETVDSFLLPDLNVIRFTTFGQNPVFVVPDRN
jgi:hypothetical protein